MTKYSISELFLFVLLIGLGDLLISTHPELASHLKKISAVTVAVASFEFDGKVLPTEVHTEQWIDSQ